MGGGRCRLTIVIILVNVLIVFAIMSNKAFLCFILFE